MISGLIRLGLVVGAGIVLTRLADWSEGKTTRSEYPNRAIEVVVPFGAGGGTDTFARIIKKGIEDNDLLPEPLVIINQGGAGATIGSRRVKEAEPDGYTMLILHDAILTAKYHGAVEYGPEAFVPIAGTGEVGMVIAVRDDSPYQDLEDLMREVHRRPDQVPFGANIGALTHFAGLQLVKCYVENHSAEFEGQAAQTKPRFRFAQIGGGADRFSDLMGGHIDVTGFSIEEFIRFRAEGLRGLAYFGQQRHPGASDVPTAIEQGYDIISTNTFYWWFPAETPSECVDVMATALRKALETEYVKQRMAAIHCESIFVHGDALQQRIARSARSLSSVVSSKTAPLPNLPTVLASVVGMLGAVLFVRGSLFSVEQRDSAKVQLQHERVGLAVWCAVLTVTYVSAISLGNVDFRIATPTFMFAVGASLTNDSRLRNGLIVLALATGFGLYYLFTKLFIINLADI